MDVLLPIPDRTRWQPLRSGLINLFKYDNEIFPFKNGRLLLRGNNGAGKSRVLALQLPFLLDGEITSSRVEPDCDPAKRLEWHLLMGEKYPHRLGYTWIEFGRVTSEGTPEFCTLGCGMEMSRGGKFHRWYFVTPLRVGANLKLVKEGNYPLTEDALELSLSSGAVYRTVREYRQAVNDRLFHLDEERFEALINLLIQLRKPQLSKNLDEKLLSKALSDSLPPLDPATLSDVAEAFRELEHDREELQKYERSSTALKHFNQSYQRYAQVAVGRKATELRDAHNAYEREQRAHRQCGETVQQAEVTRENAERRTRESKRQQEEADGVATALRNSPEMKTANDLKRLKDEADRAAESADQAQSDFTNAEIVVADRRQQVSDQGDIHKADSRRVDETIKAVRLAEASLEIRLPLDEADSSPAKTESSKRKSIAEVHRLREQQEHLSKLSDTALVAKRTLQSAEEKRNEQETRLTRGRETESEQRSEQKRIALELIAATRGWLQHAKILRLSPTEEYVETLRRWCDLINGVNPVRLAVSELLSQIENEISHRKGELSGLRESVATRRRAFILEKTNLQAGIETGPPAAYGIDVLSRSNRDGAPLWKLCDFRDDVSLVDRAGCEAALQAAGLLDAWVTPEGRLVGQDNDVFIDCQSDPVEHLRTLSSLLKAAPNSHDSHASKVEAATIERILSSIGAEKSEEVWVTATGDWHNGALSGKWLKSTAEFIGAGAREAAKLRRLAEIESELKRLDDEEDVLIQEEQALGTRRVDARNEDQSLPLDNALRDATTKWELATQNVDKERLEHERLGNIVLTRKKEYDDAWATLLNAARELNLETWVERLDQLRSSIDLVERNLMLLWPLLEALHRTAQTLERSLQELKRASAQATDFKSRSEDAANLAAKLKREYETLEAFSGEKARTALEQLKVVEENLKLLKDAFEKANKALTYASVESATAQRDLKHSQEALRKAEDERATHIEAFRQFASTGMLEQLSESPDGIESWSASRLVDFVREVHSRVGSHALSDDAWDKTQNELHREFQKLQTELSAQSLRPESESRHGVDVVSVEYNGKLRRVPELLAQLDDEISRRHELLNAGERKFIENHLIGEVADHLHKLICRAAELVSIMTAEVVKRPTTAAGMTLRFKWEPLEDGPAGTKVVCDLLKRNRATWSEIEREQLAAFLQERIQDVRSTSEFGTWREYLERAVDYREWHCFFVERKMDGDWRRMTKRTHGTGSSGEKAVALTIPQFAAAAAHYHSIPDAPRLIMLDEAFVGIDPLMRANCMGLLESFDLDFAMTSENEWGCYPTISGLSICQLATRAGVNAIAVTPWIWNGKVRSRVSSIGFNTSRAAALDQDSAK